MLRDNNFEAAPMKANRVLYRGELTNSILTSTITKGSVTTFTFGAATGIETGQCIYITGLDQDANWSSLNGIHKVTTVSNYVVTIPIDSSAWSDFNDTGSIEWVGGSVFRVELYGNRQILVNNYFDGYGLTLNSMMNSSVSGTSCTFASYENIGISIVDRAAEMISTGTPHELRYYTGVINGTNKNQIKFTSQNLTAVWLVNNYVWVYQNNGSTVYGYIRSKITGSTLSGSDTIVTLEDYIIRSDTTIKCCVEPTGWQTNRRIDWRGAIVAKPAGSL